MATLETRGHESFNIRATVGGKRHGIFLANVGREVAEDARDRITKIERCVDNGIEPATAERQWLAGLSDELHAKVAAAGLVESRKPLVVVAPKTLGDAVKQFYLTVDAKPQTRAAYRQGTDCLVEYFTARVPLASVRAEDAEKFAGRLRAEKLARATISKRLRVIKHLFGMCVRLGWISANPFAAVKPGKQTNPERLEFIEGELVKRMMQHATPEWRVILALARWGGVRTPSETFSLQWAHVDLAGGRLRVPSPKTAEQGKPFRHLPLFPELRGPLEELEAITPAGTEFVITTYRDAATNLRTQAERIAARAGVNLPAKFFQNCRASRVTELHRKHGSKAATEWIGHTKAVALSHYMMTMEADWQEAVATPTPTPPGVSGHHSGQNGVIKRDKPQCDDTVYKGRIERKANKTGLLKQNTQSKQWAQVDSNYRPRRYQRRALTN